MSQLETAVSAAARPRIPAAEPVRSLVGSLVVAGAYYGAAKIGYALEIAGPIAAIMWLPVGVGIAFLYVGGLQLWPGILVGDLLANDYSAIPLGSALGQTAGNVLEVVVAVILLRRLTRGSSALGTVRGIGAMLVAIAAGTSISATVGAISLVLGGVIGAHTVPTIWRTWWLGDSIGALVVVPVALAWYPPPARAWWRRRGVETAILLVAVGGLTELALGRAHPLTYLVFPLLIWGALRLGQRGASLAVAVAALLSNEHGTAFHYMSITESVLSTQLYIAVLALSTLLLGAVAAERETFAEEVRRSRARLVEAADAERRRIERDLHDGVQQRLTVLAGRLRRAGEPASVALLEEVEADLLLAIDELRELAHGVRPSALADFGLSGAIKSIAARSIVPIRLLELPAGRLDETAETTAYYVVAEAVTNVHKHARASFISIRVRMSRRMLIVEIDDDGVGGAAETEGSGLQGLRDRVEAIAGTFLVVDLIPHGTRITAEIPASS